MHLPASTSTTIPDQTAGPPPAAGSCSSAPPLSWSRSSRRNSARVPSALPTVSVQWRKRVQLTHLSESSGVCGSPAVDLCAASRCPKHYCPWQEFTAAGWTDAGSLLSTEAIFYCLNDVLRSSPATKAEEAAGAQVCGAGGAAVRMMMVRRRRWSESWMELLACHQRLNNPLQRAQTPPHPHKCSDHFMTLFLIIIKKRKSCHVKHLKCYTRCGSQ